MSTAPIRNLILVLGDQLSPAVTSLAAGDPGRDLVLMAELGDEARYVRHHKKKIAFLFSAMRHFADELRGLGWTVEYVTLDAPDNRGSFTAQLGDAIARHRPERVIVTEAGEWRVRQMQASWAERFSRPVDILPDERFLCPTADFARWAAGRKQLRMEYFYREMRRRTGLLMDDDAPAGGRWNFDAENRKPAKADLFMPRPRGVAPDAITREVLARWSRRASATISATWSPSGSPSRAPMRRRPSLPLCAMGCPGSATTRMRCWRGSIRTSCMNGT